MLCAGRKPETWFISPEIIDNLFICGFSLIRMKKKRDRKKDNSALVLGIVLVFVVLAAVFYLLNQDKLERRGDIVGDRICGDFSSRDAQDNCCAEVHADEMHILCEGRWEYISGNRKCQFVCTGVLPTCTEDFRVCESGDVVGRNPEYECEFFVCP